MRACLVGLLRGHKLRVRIPGIGELTSVRDEGARELFKEQTLRKTEFFPNKEENVTARDCNAICNMFEEQFQKDIGREPEAIADAIGIHFAVAWRRYAPAHGLGQIRHGCCPVHASIDFGSCCPRS